MHSTERAAPEALGPLSLGFRSRYLTYDEITRQVHAWAEAFPDLVRLESLVMTPEGRKLWLLTIGPEPDRIRPAAWVDGNIHASEVAGSSVALAIAEDVIRAHLSGASGGEAAALHDLPPHLVELLRKDVLFYVLPRMCPDGAERVLSTGAFVRSNPRDRRLGHTAPFWRTADVDGDGKALLMRRIDPTGDFVASAEVPGLMLRRTIEDAGPFYTIYPEGFIEHWDGFTVPGFNFLSDNDTDMNRNFPYAWAPEPHQQGAGASAASEPESRAIVEFATSHPNIFTWLNLHTFGGCYIRPAGDKPDNKMDPQDLSVYRMIGGFAEEITGYPMVSGFEEFTYEPDKPLCGDLSTFAYAQRGAVSMVCELWDFWKQVGLTIHRPFVQNYQRRTRADVIAMGRWDREHNQGRVLGAWTSCDHPQLGPVEVGGYDPRFGVWNPPPERLAEVCDNQSRVFLRIASLAPRLQVRSPSAVRIEGDLFRVTAIVENIGFLPTHVLSSSKALPWNDPVRARAIAGDGLKLISGEETQVVSHLQGWGDHDAMLSLLFARSTADTVRRPVEWVVQGKGRLLIRAGCARTGQVEAQVEVG